jgi:hypothetical protein
MTTFKVSTSAEFFFTNGELFEIVEQHIKKQNPELRGFEVSTHQTKDGVTLLFVVGGVQPEEWNVPA